MPHDQSSLTNSVPAVAVRPASTAGLLTPAQRDFTRLVGRLLADAWDRSPSHDDPHPPPAGSLLRAENRL